jgi:beta-galactosidase GanA
MKLRPLLTLVLLIPGALLAQQGAAPAPSSELPRFIEKDGRHAFIVDGAPFLMMAAQCNNSSAWPGALPGVWLAMDRLKANTLEAPVYWEQFEPEPGTFDTTIVDQMIREAREHHLRLVLLWFGTWKNGSSHYEPLWAKADPEHYPRIIGKDGQRVDSPSPHSDVALKADSRAFAALMRHIRTEDPGHTVIMVQVENESGSWGSVRDYSPAAQAIFGQPVPAELLAALGLSAKAGGDWRAVFGTDADEYFHAWSVARYVGQVAAAGKVELALPMYANAALRDPISPGPASTYESGGPTDNVLSIWKAAAPALDALAPDIYLRDTARYNRVLELYSRPDNPLMVPENGGFPSYAPKFFSALGKGAVGWGPFGIDRGPDAYTPITGRKPDEDPLAEFAVNYRMVAPAMREIARLNFEGKLQAVAEEPDAHTVSLSFGPWRADVSYGAKSFGAAADPKGNAEPTGRALVAQLGPDEFLVAGHGCRIDFRPSDAASKAQREFLRVEEGSYENGAFVPVRIWNGDQTDYGLNFGTAPVVLRVRLGTY